MPWLCSSYPCHQTMPRVGEFLIKLFLKLPEHFLLKTLCFSSVVLFLLIISLNRVDAASALGGPTGEIIALPDKPEVPDFTLTDTQGHSYTLSDYRGSVIVVNFWSVWCAPCRKEMPSMQRAWEQVREEEILIVAVNWKDDAEEVAQFFEPIPVDFPVLLGGDDAMLRQWSVKGLPTTFIVDPRGRLVYRVVGEYEWDQPEMLAKLRALQE